CTRPPCTENASNTLPPRGAPVTHLSSTRCTPERRPRPSSSTGPASDSTDTFSTFTNLGAPPTGSPSASADASTPVSPTISHDRTLPPRRHASAAALPAHRSPLGLQTTTSFKVP